LYALEPSRRNRFGPKRGNVIAAGMHCGRCPEVETEIKIRLDAER